MEREIKCKVGKKALSGMYRAEKFSSLTLLFAMILALIMVVGCATDRGVHLPPVASNPSGKVNIGKFVWMDLLTEDTSAAQRFYGDLFGWRAEISKENKDYYVFFKGNKPIGGMAAHENRDEKKPESLWLMSLSVSDVDQAAALVKEKGGKILEGPVNMDGRGRMALISDPAGAPVILLRAAGGDPAGEKADMGEWLWTDLFTQDAEAAGQFYEALVGYHTKTVDVGQDHRYQVLQSGDQMGAGIVELQWPDLEDNWVPYIKVDNVDQTVEKARNLGAKLITQDKNVALLFDPTGAVFGIQKI